MQKRLGGDDQWLQRRTHLSGGWIWLILALLLVMVATAVASTFAL